MRVFEKECRSALVKSGIPGTEYCLNPYGGCAHACVYCYAAFMRRFLGTDLPWGSFVQVKVNFAQRLAAQLKRPKQGTVLLSTVTDPYQPVERHYCLTRASLEALAGTGLRVSILTKSDLVVRDLDVITRLPDVEVGFSVTTAEDDTARWLEPGAPGPSRRFAALHTLAAAGVRTWVFVSPVIPAVADSEAALAAILERAREAGAAWADYDPLNFYPSAVANLHRLFSRRWPQRVPALQEAQRDVHAYRERVAALAAAVWPRFGYDLS